MQHDDAGVNLAVRETALWTTFTRDVQSAVGARHDALLDAGGEVACEYLRFVRALVERDGVAGAVLADRGRSTCCSHVFEHGGQRRTGSGHDQGFACEVVREVPRGFVGASESSETASSAREGEVVEERVVEGSGDGEAELEKGRRYAENKRKKAKKQKKKAAGSASSVAAGSACVAGASREASSVPEWRRKDGGAMYHKGVFSDCSSEVQQELRESRARMLVASNEAAVAEAEQRRRFAEARLKSRSVEEEVEKNRLELDKRLRGLRAETATGCGYAETVASAVGTPSLSEGSVSPNSSISVAELNKKDEAIRFLASELEAVKVQSKEKVDLLIVRVMELEQKVKMTESPQPEPKPEQPQTRQPAGRAPGSWERQAFDREFSRVVGDDAGAGSDCEEELTYEEMEAEAAQFFATGALR